MEEADFLEESEKDVLGRFFGILSVAENAQTAAVDQGLVALDQQIERGRLMRQLFAATRSEFFVGELVLLAAHAFLG